ncbi:MAG: hypothetical protein ABIO70_22575 [Pseudomonadota bacterium]
MPRLHPILITSFASTLFAAPAWAGLHFGEPVERAAALHVTPAGLTHIGDAIEGLVPQTFPVEDISGEVVCAEGDLVPLTYALDSLQVLISADDVQIVPSEGRLDVTLYGTISSSPATFVAQGDCSVLTSLDESCNLEIPTTALSAHLGMAITDVEGTFDVLVDDLSIAISPINNPLSDCTLASVTGTLLGQDPAAISNLLLSFIEPELEGLDETIAQSLEDALNSLTLQTPLDLGGIPMDLSLYPSRLELGDDGVILGFGAQIDADGTAECVDAAAGSPFQDSPWPVFGATPEGSSLAYDLGVVISRDFVDHLLWALWASGTLCIDLQDLAGTELQTSLLESFFGDSFSALFPESTPAMISVRPEGQPVAVFSDDVPPLGVAVSDLGLNLLAELDARQTRIFRVGIDAEVGVNVLLDSEAVTPELYLDPAAFTYRETFNDLLAEGFSDGFQGLVEMVLDMFLPDDLISPITLPDLYGIGIDGLFWIPAEDDSWQGLYVLVDSSEVEPLEIGGCSGGSLGCGEGDTGMGGGIDLGQLGCDDQSGGCGGCGGDSGGCEESSGCSGGGCGVAPGLRVPAWAPWRALLLFGLLGAVALRRRQR